MSLQAETSLTGPADWTVSLSYQSTATRRPTIADLSELTERARRRNHSLGVTGLLLYDRGQFFQTVEGPPESIKTIWESISRDSRHTDIDILSEHIIPTRLFGNWDLLSRHGDAETSANIQQSKAAHQLTSQVPVLIEKVLNGDDIGTNTLIASFAEAGWQGDLILCHLIEPTARALGDVWMSDDCSELDLTIGLSMLQLAGHAVRHTPTPEELKNRKYSILLATMPGETHSLGTSLLADLFTDAGWHVDMAFPDSTHALTNQLKAQQPDALDLGLSESLLRRDSVVQLRETIERSRFAAPDHLTVISVGGRLFADAIATAESVGADHARKTVAGASVRIAELIRQKRQLPR